MEVQSFLIYVDTVENYETLGAFYHYRFLLFRPEFGSFDELSQHIRRKHELFYCDLCVEHLKLFSWERKCYTRSELGQHRRTGDSDDRSHRGHPLCEFCDVRYLDDDLLYRHLRIDHFFCHYCDADGRTKIFYPTPEKLKDHFKSEHFLCEIGNCRSEQLGISFRHEVDFKAHKGNVHGRDLQKGELKKELQVNINFNYGPNPVRDRFSKQNDRPVRNYPNQRERVHAQGDSGGESRTPRANQQVVSAENVSVIAAVTPSAPPAVDDKFDLKRNDFPSLRQNHTGAIAKNRQTNQAIRKNTENKPALSNVVNKTVRRGSLGENDFPVLNKPAQISIKQTTVEPQKVKNDRFRRDSRSVSPKRHNKVSSTFRMVDDDEEFPSCSVIPVVPDVEKSKTPAAQVVSSEVKTVPKANLPSWGPPRLLGESEIKDSNFPSLPSPAPSSKNAKKSKTASKQSSAAANANSNKTATATGWAQKVQQEPKPKIPVNNTPKPTIDRKEFPALVSLPKTKARARLVAQNKQRHSSEDAEKIKSENVFKTNEESMTEIKEENPSILKQENSEKIEQGCYMGPPGFDVAPPPGFSSDVPPGFQRSGNAGNLPNGHSDYPIVAKENNGAAVATYTKPKTFQRRNRDLFDFLCENLAAERLSEFKSLSSLYKKGEVTSDFYYTGVKDLLGEKLFRRCFAELICLLPDVSKQNELLKSYKDRNEEIKQPGSARRSNKETFGKMAAGAPPWKNDFVLDSIRICQMCSQITTVEDYAEHYASHSRVDDEYPALY